MLRARLVDGNVETTFDPGNDRVSGRIDDGGSAGEAELHAVGNDLLLGRQTRVV